MSTHTTTPFERHGQSDLVEAIADLQAVEDCLVDGVPQCPMCGSTTKSLPGLSNHTSKVHPGTVAGALLGTDRWREILDVCYSQNGMATRRIASHLPGHTGKESVRDSIERFGLSEPDEPYGVCNRHPEDPFRKLVVDTEAAAKKHLSSPTVSTFKSKQLADVVGARASRVGRALEELKGMGRAESVNSSSPQKWVLTDAAYESSLVGDGE